jgi:DnaJ like chaperone protein
MSWWDNLQSAVDQAKRRTLGGFLDTLAAQRARRDDMAFSIALIALSAKMARADGVVSDDEFAAFCRFFSFPPSEEPKVLMIYRLAQQDVAGFEHYVARVAKLFAATPAVLEDVLDCLFYIAGADGVEHPRERALLEDAARAFGVAPAAVRRLKAVHLGLDTDDPYSVLGVEPGVDAAELRAVYRTLVRENHPDALIARGVPPSLVKIAEARMAAINAAYERVNAGSA